MVRRKVVFPLIFAALALVIIACQAISGPGSKPTVIIASPPSESVYTLGEEVAVQSTATDPLGITQVTLLVDGNVARDDPSPVAQGQAQFSLIQSWIADSVGQHLLTVRATNSQGATSESGIRVTVQAQTGNPSPTSISSIATAVPIATIPPLPTSAPQTDVPTGIPPNNPPTQAPPACVVNSRFVADVTIPDGTTFTPNAVFTKTWRVLNNGNCAWENFTLVFVSGTQMAANGIYPVPSTPPGGTADLVVPMTAPSNYGAYSGNWKMRDAAGQLFGTQLTVVINVPSPVTTVPPSHTPPPTSTGCSGQPNDFTLGASATTITTGQSTKLSWTQVKNASAVYLIGGEFGDSPGQGVETPGERIVSPNANTTYTLKAICSNGGKTREKSVTITVNAGVANFSGNWYHNFGTMVLAQAGANVNGSYTNASGGSGEINGSVTGNVLDGTYNINGGSGTIKFTLGPNGKTFTGNFDGTTTWCGAKNGQNFPNGCSYAGNWTSDYGDGDCPMTLQRQDLNVTGSYCLGTLSGTISFANQFAILSGTYNNNAPSSGPFEFFLPAFSGQSFSGNYNVNKEWCGWRNNSSKPNPCLRQ